ncbi:MAG: DUF1150 family protein [Maritimibacter sp.]
MDVKYEGFPETEERIVYVREVSIDDLPDELRAQTEGLTKLYAVHNADGERLAVVGDRDLAFALARQIDFAPVPVH